MDRVKRNGAIEFWRFMFCLMVVIYHGRALGDSNFKLLTGGYIGVEFFFLVSGFLMVGSAVKAELKPHQELGTDTFHFIWRKIKVIFPYFLFAFIVGFILNIITGQFSIVDIFKNIAYSLWELFFLRMSGIHTNVINGSTWYISAMLITMLILYPLIRKNRNVFTHIIAPLICIFLLGYLSNRYGYLDVYAKWTGLVYKGLLRSIADISLGCICYEVCQKLKSIKLNNIQKLFLTVVELGGYSLVFVITQYYDKTQLDFTMLLILAVCVTISFSRTSIISSLFNNKLFCWLGKFSMILYLNHIYCKDYLLKLDLDMSYWRIFAIYMISALITSLISMFLIESIQKLYKNRHSGTLNN